MTALLLCHSVLNDWSHLLSRYLLSSLLHLRELMGKTKYASLVDTTNQTAVARNPYSVLSAETMPTIPKADFSLRLGWLWIIKTFTRPYSKIEKSQSVQ